MQIVIDISERRYKDIQRIASVQLKSNYFQTAEQIIASGTPLPKGHGNIYDENDIKKRIENPYQCQTVLNGLKLIKPILGADNE